MEFSESLLQIRQQGLLRTRRILETAQGVSIRINGRDVTNFCSNDYLGLASHPDVVRAFQEAAGHYGVGSGSAHLICGHTAAHHELEEKLADFTGRDRALLFSAGYMANLGAITALTAADSWILQDRLNHASLLDGGLLSRARFKRYKHADVADLQKKWPLHSASSLIVTDGVFSMDGDLAPLPQLAEFARDKQSLLMVDDAHGLGVLGARGGGVCEHFSLSQTQVPVLVGTLGKALGTGGAFVAGSSDLIEFLMQKARPYIYTTALPAAVAAATRASLDLLIEESWRRDKLQQLIVQFQRGAEQLNLRLLPTASAIQPVLIGDSEQAVRMSDRLFQCGFLVAAIRPPTVPSGEARLRVTFSAQHNASHIDALLQALAKIVS